MSKIGVLIAVFVALLLGAAGWLLLGNSSAPSSTEFHEVSGPILNFRPSDVREVQIDIKDKRRQRIVRDGESWTLAVERAEDAAPDTWPVSGGQVRPLLSVLQALSPVAVAKASQIDSPAVVLTLRLADGSTQTLRLGPDAVGGRRLAQGNNGDVVLVDQLLVEALTEPGPRAWREMRVFPGVGAETSRLEIFKDGAIVSLARVRGEWRLREPVRAAGDRAAIDRLVNQLATLAVQSWIDDPGAARHDGDVLTSNDILMVIERDRRIVDEHGEPGVETDRREVLIGGAANLSGSQRLIFVGDARTPGIVDSSAVAALATSPTDLVSRRAMDIAASQIAAIQIDFMPIGDSGEPIRIDRTIDGWSASDDREINPSDIDALIKLLTEKRATEFEIGNSPAESPDAVITCFGFDGEPIAEANLFKTSGAELVTTSDGVVRLYTEVQAPALLNRR